ncbi:MAG: serine hydrolase [Pseudomonadales bacterium]|jgi:CubicO group peptidase (beta-lactamase class C family)|nr:serine hydrolase [Pseudomonadales bacterium]
MTRRIAATVLCMVLAGASAHAELFDHQREMVQRGVQAVLMCNGLFTSNRSLEQVFEQELAYLAEPVGSVDGGPWRVHRTARAVEVGDPSKGVPVMRAAFREGLGCVVLSPEQTLEDVDSLPRLDPVVGPEYAAAIPWPNGDQVPQEPLPPAIDGAALQAASDWAFDRPGIDNPGEQDTLSLLVVHRGRLVHERYAPGVDRHTRTRTWSTAKSIAVTLIGMLVDEGRLELDAPLPFAWLPEPAADEGVEARGTITLRHVLNMSSGLYPVDSWGREYVTGSGLSYWAGASSAAGARDRGLIREPGTRWDYENYDTLLAVYAMKQALGDEAAYHRFPRERLFDPIGMHTILASTDRFGDFVMSSQVYSNARDLARFGLLWEQGGVWNGERLLSEAWIDFARTPAPATAGRGNFYGGQFWLVPDDRDDVPADAYSTAGNRGQYVIIDPSHDLVIVRRGLDHGRQGFDRWDLLREVLKAFPDH